MKNRLSLSAVSVATCFSIFAVNAQAIDSSNFQEFVLKPVLTAWGYTGDRLLGQVQALLPLGGNQQQILFAEADGSAINATNEWTAGGGLGYRRIIHDNLLLGGYLLFDAVRSPLNYSYSILNPGIEVLGKIWEGRANGYIPASSQKTSGPSNWADDFDQYGYANYSGHTEIDSVLQQYEMTGKGLDAEVGRTIPWLKGLSAYAGGYYFNIPNGQNVKGADARVAYEANNYLTFEVREAYDNVKHNAAYFDIKFKLGGFNQQEKEAFGLSGKLLDPIEHRYFAVPFQTRYETRGSGTEHDNIWFFTPGASPSPGSNDVTGDGTYENPLTGFTNDDYALVLAHSSTGTVDQHPLMYFTSGPYNFNDFSNTFSLPSGWGMYGRSAVGSNSFAAPAMGDNRPLFDIGAGSLWLNYSSGQGTDQTTLDSIRVKNSNSGQNLNTATLYLNNAANVVIRNSDFENSVTSSSNTYVYGITANNSTLSFEQLDGSNPGANTVSATATATGSASAVAYGIRASSGSYVNFSSGANTVSSNATASDTGAATSYGVYADSGVSLTNTLGVASTINFSGGNNTITSVSSSADYINNGGINSSSYGIYADSSNVNFSGGTNNVTSTAIGNLAPNSHGVDLENSNLTISGGTNTVTSSAAGYRDSNISGYYYSYGIYAAGTSGIYFTSSATPELTINTGIPDSINSPTQSIVTGIYFSTNSSLWNGATQVTQNNASDFANHLIFNRTSGSTSGTGSGKIVYYNAIPSQAWTLLW